MNLNKELYSIIFKRKSFHLFRNIGNDSISANDIENIKEIYKTLIPLCPDIKTAIKIVPANETTCKRGQQFCILLYSEKRDNYLQNIGYLGEQLDLYLVSQNIGTLWFGIGKTNEPSYDGLDFIIMIAISKVDSAKICSRANESLWMKFGWENHLGEYLILLDLPPVLAIHSPG